MKSSLLLPPLLALVLFLPACAENPADGVAAADVKDVSGDGASSANAPAGTRKLVFAEASTIGFTGSKVTGSHEGGFRKFNGHVSVAGDQLAAGPHEVIIDMKSTWADQPKLETHLKSADFFDVETYPQATFKLNSLEHGEGPDYTLSGEFTLRGVTKAISFPATITAAGDGYHLVAEFVISRRDFGIRYPGKPDDLIRDEVVIRLDLTAVQ